MAVQFKDTKTEYEVVRGSTEFKQTVKLIFSDLYELLTRVAENDGDTLWYNDGTTGHEALIDIAYKYDDQLGDELQARLEKDCDFTH